jgi:hypothetical protein
MKYLLAIAAMLSTAAVLSLGTAAGFPPRVHYIDHDKARRTDRRNRIYLNDLSDHSTADTTS